MVFGPCGGVAPDGSTTAGVRQDGGPSPLLDLPSLRSTAGRLAGQVDAVLLGDHGGARVQLPPSLRADVVRSEGGRAWAGLNCRDRNRVALEGELAGLAAVGAAGVHWAQVAFVNHTSGPAALVVDAGSAAVLRSFTGLELPPGYLDGILAAPDVQAAGVRAAVRLALDLLAVAAAVRAGGSAAPTAGASS